VPHAFSFIRYFLNSAEPEWLKDLVRCEVWLNRSNFTISSEQQIKWRDLLGIGSRGEIDFVVVSHDVTVTIQEIIGYRETTMSRVGEFLWLLGVAPIRLTQNVVPQPGIAVLAKEDGRNDSLRYISAD
jgi:hypothetical protein